MVMALDAALQECFLLSWRVVPASAVHGGGTVVQQWPGVVRTGSLSTTSSVVVVNEGGAVVPALVMSAGQFCGLHDIRVVGYHLVCGLSVLGMM